MVSVLVTAVEGRPATYIRGHLKRRYHPKNQLGAWTKSEDNALIQ